MRGRRVAGAVQSTHSMHVMCHTPTSPRPPLPAICTHVAPSLLAEELVKRLETETESPKPKQPKGASAPAQHWLPTLLHAVRLGRIDWLRGVLKSWGLLPLCRWWLTAGSHSCPARWPTTPLRLCALRWRAVLPVTGRLIPALELLLMPVRRSSPHCAEHQPSQSSSKVHRVRVHKQARVSAPSSGNRIVNNGPAPCPWQPGSRGAISRTVLVPALARGGELHWVLGKVARALLPSQVARWLCHRPLHKRPVQLSSIGNGGELLDNGCSSWGRLMCRCSAIRVLVVEIQGLSPSLQPPSIQRAV
jgi:hypothetical protein